MDAERPLRFQGFGVGRGVRPIPRGVAMKHKAKSDAAKRRGGVWLVAVAAVIFVLILIVRMLVFVTPHGRRF